MVDAQTRGGSDSVGGAEFTHGSGNGRHFGRSNRVKCKVGVVGGLCGSLSLHALALYALALEFFGRGLVEPHEAEYHEAHKQQAGEGVFVHYSLV